MKAKKATPLNLNENPVFFHAKRKLQQLETALKENTTRLEGLLLAAVRGSSDIKNLVSRGPSALPALTEGALDVLAARVIDADGAIPASVMHTLRTMRTELKFRDPDDQAEADLIRDTQGSVELLKRAVVIQRARSATAKTAAMRSVLRSVEPERATITGALAAAIANLAEVLKAEGDLLAALDAQDVEIREVLDVAPCPLVVDEPLLAWIEAVRGRGWLPGRSAIRA